jgi:hypothetical protein
MSEDRPRSEGSRLKQEIEALRQSHAEAEEYQILTAGDSEVPAPVDVQQHQDLTPESASALLFKKTKTVSPGEAAEQKAGENDPVFSALRKRKTPEHGRWLDIK